MSEDKTPRRPSPTSRARRIGGRPVPRPDPDTERDPATVSGTRPDPRPDSRPDARSDSRPGARSDSRPDSPADMPADMPAAPVTAAQPAPRYDSDPEPGATPRTAPGTPARRSFPVEWIPAMVLGVAVLVLAVFVVVVSHGVYWAKADNSSGARTVRQEQVLAATKKCFAQINTYDYRKLDGLLATDLACTTGTFSNDLRQALQTQILKLAPKLKAIQTAQINKAGIAAVSPSGDQVVTLIYGQLAQSNSTTAKASPRIDVVGAVVTVDRVHGQWLIAKVANDTGNSLGS